MYFQHYIGSNSDWCIVPYLTVWSWLTQHMTFALLTDIVCVRARHNLQTDTTAVLIPGQIWRIQSKSTFSHAFIHSSTKLSTDFTVSKYWQKRSTHRCSGSRYQTQTTQRDHTQCIARRDDGNFETGTDCEHVHRSPGNIAQSLDMYLQTMSIYAWSVGWVLNGRNKCSICNLLLPLVGLPFILPSIISYSGLTHQHKSINLTSQYIRRF